jgi:selenium metabolism protein YedF
MQTFVKTIIEMNPLPRTIICYNAGVRLVCEESKVLEALRELERRGVEILVCGTCLDYFEILGQLKVGKLSNMLEIMSSLHNADRVVSPM